MDAAHLDATALLCRTSAAVVDVWGIALWKGGEPVHSGRLWLEVVEQAAIAIWRRAEQAAGSGGDGLLGPSSGCHSDVLANASLYAPAVLCWDSWWLAMVCRAIAGVAGAICRWAW